MELKVSSTKETLSPPVCDAEPVEKEVSDEDDDDRNHKHRRRETRSQSMEREGLEVTRPYRKQNKHFENGYQYRGEDSQTSETWRHYNSSSQEKDFNPKFGRRRQLNQRIRVNQTFPGDLGRGRDAGSWSQRDLRFGSVDIASHMVQPGSMAPSLFGGRGLSNVSSGPSASWAGFGLHPGVPNGGLDAFHSIGLPGTFRPPIGSSLNIGIPRQRCRDFEERGFCLRGDMCPMEHGVNRIVVEDVQSLSQFNLPVTLPSAAHTPAPVGPGSLCSIGAASALANSKGLHSKSTKPGMFTDGLGFNDSYPGTGGTDFYDPDQPLWSNGAPETSTAVSKLHSSKIDETEQLLDDDRHIDADSDYFIRGTGAIGSESTNLPVWGRIGNSNNRSNAKERTDATLSLSDCIENDAKEDKKAIVGSQDNSLQGTNSIVDNAGSKVVDLPSMTQNDVMGITRKPSQKAMCTLFVNKVPPKSNRKEALLSHFQKFGDVIDIYIPLNGDRAFVQFSRREEAEAALKAPDAVMGNRFIKLWWANRDNIPDNGLRMNNSNRVSETSGKVTAASVAASVLPHQSVSNKGKDVAASKGNLVHAGEIPQSITNSKIMPSQKKLETLEHLKEELRKKQEMLDKKRVDFRRKLDKLEKQKATGIKSEMVIGKASKRVKVEVAVAVDLAKVAATSSSDPGVAISSLHPELLTESNKSKENVASHNPISTTSMVLHEPTSLKHHIHPFTLGDESAMIPRYKLDNRPTTFRIHPPLPVGFADIGVVKEHFSLFGEVPTVEFEHLEARNGVEGLETSRNCVACVGFTTRHSAEKAFVNGKCWQGQNLQFTWVKSSNSSNLTSKKEKSLSAIKEPVDADIQIAEKELTRDVAPPKEATASGIEETQNNE